MPLIFAFALVASASTGIYKEERTGIEFPESIDSFQRDEVKSYGPGPGKKENVAIAYHASDAAVTVNIRALGVETNMTSGSALRETLAAIKMLQTEGIYPKAQIVEHPADQEKPGWKSAEFTSSSTNQFMHSVICCKVASGYLLKIRASTTNTEVHRLDAITKALQDTMDRVSTTK